MSTFRLKASDVTPQSRRALDQFVESRGPEPLRTFLDWVTDAIIRGEDITLTEESHGDDPIQRIRRHEHREFRRWVDMAGAQEDSMGSDEDALIMQGRDEAAQIMLECLAADEADWGQL